MSVLPSSGGGGPWPIPTAWTNTRSQGVEVAVELDPQPDTTGNPPTEPDDDEAERA